MEIPVDIDKTNIIIREDIIDKINTLELGDLITFNDNSRHLVLESYNSIELLKLGKMTVNYKYKNLICLKNELLDHINNIIDITKGDIKTVKQENNIGDSPYSHFGYIYK